MWVRRALGPFWGYQEGWLSLSASIFDMAIYPAIFVLYLGKFNPALTAGWQGYAWSLAVVVLCCLWNLRGAPAVGEGSVGMFTLLLAPFVVFVILCLWRGISLHPSVQWGQAGSETRFPLRFWWPCGITWAGTMHPPWLRRWRTRSATISCDGLCSPSGGRHLYSAAGCPRVVRPVCSKLLHRRLDERGHHHWWSVAGLAVVAGGAICGIGMFNALMMSYTRLPMALRRHITRAGVTCRRMAMGRRV